MKKLSIPNHTVESLETLLRSNPNYVVGTRIMALIQIKKGMSSRKLQEFYYKSHSRFCEWVKSFNAKGVEGLLNKSKSGRKPLLNNEHRAQLKNVLQYRSPCDFGFNTATWNGPLVAEYIKSNFGVEYKKAQVYNIIKSLGFTFQKAKGRYPEADPVKQKEFIETLKKKLLEEPKSTVFLFEDEFSLSNTATLSYYWSIKGVQPIIDCKQKVKERQTTFGSLNIETGQITISFAYKGNYKSFKKHLKKILKTYKIAKKIIVILDNVRYHHAKLLKLFLEKHTKLELLYLPPYSPELNPIERAWWYMRKKITHNRYVNSLKERKIMFWQMFSHFTKPNEELLRVCNVNY